MKFISGTCFLLLAYVDKRRNRGLTNVSAREHVTYTRVPTCEHSGACSISNDTAGFPYAHTEKTVRVVLS